MAGGVVGDGAELLEALDLVRLSLVLGPQDPADRDGRDLAPGHAVVEAGDLFEGPRSTS